MGDSASRRVLEGMSICTSKNGKKWRKRRHSTFHTSSSILVCVAFSGNFVRGLRWTDHLTEAYLQVIRRHLELLFFLQIHRAESLTVRPNVRPVRPVASAEPRSRRNFPVPVARAFCASVKIVLERHVFWHVKK